MLTRENIQKEMFKNALAELVDEAKEHLTAVVAERRKAEQPKDQPRDEVPAAFGFKNYAFTVAKYASAKQFGEGGYQLMCYNTNGEFLGEFSI